MEHTDLSHETILILDFGSQYTQLIARRVREQHVFSDIHPFNVNFDQFKNRKIKGIILSGGPSSVYETEAPKIGQEVFQQGIPVLGICYGLQLITDLFDGQVGQADHKEYGPAQLSLDKQSPLFKDIPNTSRVWMSHGDKILTSPRGFHTIAKTANAPFAAIQHDDAPIYGLQFHPEVTHTEFGSAIIRNFVLDVCTCAGDWSPASFVEESVRLIRERVGEKQVLCGLSGGVDSSVVAALIHKAIGKQLHCVFVDNGLLRLDEDQDVEQVFREHFDIKLTSVNKRQLFYDKLSGVSDPEQKRKIIGNEFIRVFEETAKSLGKFDYLAQGTLYPDVIESVSFKGPSVTIKSHHNVGGLPKHFDFELLEPLRELFKDEVREVGRELGLPESIIGRHPFPGPGLAVRILGSVTPERVDILQKADAIYIESLFEAKIYNEIWQAFAVLLPVQTVGVMGDQRTYENVLALRAVTSVDGMTANWYEMPYDVLAKVSNRIINEVPGINRVVYDVSSKPPATIEWE